MQQSGSVKSAEQGGRGRRWGQMALNAAVLAIVGMTVGMVLNIPQKVSPSAKTDPVGHVKARQKAEIDLRFKQGVAMLQAKQYEYALTAFHRVLQIDPEMPEAHVNAGFALLGLGQPKAARDFFDTAINLRPRQFNAYYGLGEALDEMGDTFGAMQAMETFTHLAPQTDPFWPKASAAAWELRAKLEAQKAYKEEMDAQKAKKPGASQKP